MQGGSVFDHFPHSQNWPLRCSDTPQSSQILVLDRLSYAYRWPGLFISLSTAVLAMLTLTARLAAIYFQQVAVMTDKAFAFLHQA